MAFPSLISRHSKSHPSSGPVFLSKRTMLLTSRTSHTAFFLVGMWFPYSWPNWLLVILHVCQSRCWFLYEIFSVPPTMPSICPVTALTTTDSTACLKPRSLYAWQGLDYIALIYHHLSCAPFVLERIVKLNNYLLSEQNGVAKALGCPHLSPLTPHPRPHLWSTGLLRGQTGVPQRKWWLRRWLPWTKQWPLHPRTPKLRSTRVRLGPKGSVRTMKPGQG